MKNCQLFKYEMNGYLLLIHVLILCGMNIDLIFSSDINGSIDTFDNVYNQIDLRSINTCL